MEAPLAEWSPGVITALGAIPTSQVGGGACLKAQGRSLTLPALGTGQAISLHVAVSHEGAMLTQVALCDVVTVALSAHVVACERGGTQR